MLVGNGMAGVRVLEELLEAAPGLYDIAVFGAEPYGNYNRILLSPVLAGEKQIGDIMLNDEAWYERHDIRLHKGKEVTRIDRRALGSSPPTAPRRPTIACCSPPAPRR